VRPPYFPRKRGEEG
jgi:hypothetical protein